MTKEQQLKDNFDQLDGEFYDKTSIKERKNNAWDHRMFYINLLETILYFDDYFNENPGAPPDLRNMRNTLFKHFEKTSLMIPKIPRNEFYDYLQGEVF
jgi:hypothetical protein